MNQAHRSNRLVILIVQPGRSSQLFKLASQANCSAQLYSQGKSFNCETHNIKIIIKATFLSPNFHEQVGAA